MQSSYASIRCDGREAESDTLGKLNSSPHAQWIPLYRGGFHFLCGMSSSSQLLNAPSPRKKWIIPLFAGTERLPAPGAPSPRKKRNPPP